MKDILKIRKDRIKYRLGMSKNYKELFSSELGRIVLKDILFNARINRPCRDEKEEGMRILALAILNQVNGKYDEYQSNLIMEISEEELYPMEE